MTGHTIKVGAIRQGDSIPGLYPWLGRQVVEEVRQEGNLITIITNIGDWTLDYRDDLSMPMRDDEDEIEFVDWREKESPPLAVQLYIGDILPSPHPVERPEMFQTVLRMQGRATKNIEQATLVTQDSDGAIHRYPIRAIDVITFPRLEDSAANGRSGVRGKGFGPYRDEDGNEYWLVTHPTGRGRWPRMYPPFKFGTESGPVFRPPTRQQDWDRLTFIGEGDRHPQDPLVLRVVRRKYYKTPEQRDREARRMT